MGELCFGLIFIVLKSLKHWRGYVIFSFVILAGWSLRQPVVTSILAMALGPVVIIVALSMFLRPSLLRYTRRKAKYHRIWKPFCLAHNLAYFHTKKGRIIAPRLYKIKCKPWADWLYLRMLPGQVPLMWESSREAFAHTFGVDRCLVWAIAPGRMCIRVQRRKPEPVFEWEGNTSATVHYK